MPATQESVSFSRRFDRDAKGRLTRVTGEGPPLSHRYDAAGDLVQVSAGEAAAAVPVPAPAAGPPAPPAPAAARSFCSACGTPAG